MGMMKLTGWYLWRAKLMAQLYKQGHTYEQIADRFWLSVNTVYQTIRWINQKGAIE